MSGKSANPAPLGLLGFGMSTILLNFLLIIQSVKDVKTIGQIDAMIIGMGIFYGGLAQIIAGILEYKRGNTFTMVAFTSYGLFWLSFITLNWLGTNSVARAGIMPFLGGPYYGTPWLVSNEAFAAYFFMWGIFTSVMFFGTLKANRTLQFFFISLAVLFFLLAAKSVIQVYDAISTEHLAIFTRAIGTEGVICGASAVYLALAEVLNEMHGKTMLPT
ncbi:MAG: acetate uptake transporter [Candidatus Bathyarchaeia archaeon]